MRQNADQESDTDTLRPQLAAGSPRKIAQKIDRYELFEMIGCGGMGAVYRAIDTKLGRTVALKTAAAQRNGARLTDRVRQRFLREAMALSKVEHRNVVQVLDFGFADDGTPFLVMEHLRGRDLGALLAASERPLPVTDVVDIMLAVCAALRACHRAGIIHRDLKPGNIFLAETETGREVKVLDFGVSKAPTADDLTREGQILGTPQYLAPEQVDGKVGPASDQYALGVVLYVCLTLRLPFEDHQNRQLLRAIETGTFESPRTFRADLPEALEAIVLRAMHVSPSERFESVYALGQRLWDLASPRSQAEWRSYYFPRSPGGPGGPGGRGGYGTAAVVVARTQILESSSAGEPKDEGGALFGLPTKAAPSSVPLDLPSLDEWSAPEAQSVESLPRSPSRRQLVTAAVVLLALTGAFAARLRASRRRAPARQAAQVVPRTATRFVQTSAPIATSPPQRPAPQAALAGAGRSSDVPPSPGPAPPVHHRRLPRGNHAPAERSLPNIDQAGIGIPSE